MAEQNAGRLSRTNTGRDERSPAPSNVARTFDLIRSEVVRILKDPFAAPMLLVLAILLVATLSGQLALWVAVIAFATFALGFRLHRNARERDRLAQGLLGATTETAHSDNAAAARGLGAAEPGWRSIVDGLPDPAVLIDQDGLVAHYNPLLADLFPRVRIGAPLTHLTRNPELLAALEKPQSDPTARVIHLEDRVPVHRSLSAFVSTIPDETSGGRPRSLVVFRDLTDQQKHAQLRADFISHASHELRTPLASLKSMVETLQGPARDDVAAREKFLAMMQAQASRMTRLIDDLLSLSRAEMRVHVAPTGRVELNELVQWVGEAMGPMAQSHEADVVIRTLDEPAWVRGERDDLVQVFQNLLQNAIKYGRDGGRIEIALDRIAPVGNRPARISVSVSDDGPGIPPEHLPRITERFYRVSAATSREKGGTGLGLAIVKHIVNRHRGELKVASEVGKGTTFTVVLDAGVATGAVAPSLVTGK